MTPQDRELLADAANVAANLTLDALDDAVMRSLVREHGADIATGVLFDRVRSSQRHALLAASIAEAAEPGLPDRFLLGVVPGAFYDRNRHTGADGERIIAIARRSGIDASRVPIHPFASPTSNGRIIADWLAQASSDGRDVVLVTLSKGTLDALAAVHCAEPHALAHLRGWLSLSGLWNGTALVDWLDFHPIQKLVARGAMAVSRRPFGTVETLRRRSRVDLRTDLPRVISVVGMPLRRHLRHRWAPKAYDRLSMFGPSDGGGIVLSDIRLFPGEVYPIWGTDHYLDPEWDIEPLIARLLYETTRPIAPSATIANATPAARSIT